MPSFFTTTIVLLNERAEFIKNELPGLVISSSPCADQDYQSLTIKIADGFELMSIFHAGIKFGLNLI